MKFKKTPNYVIADDGGNYYIKVYAEDRWRDAVGRPDLCDEKQAGLLEEALCSEAAAEWIGKAAKADADLAEKLKALEEAEEAEKADA